MNTRALLLAALLVLCLPLGVGADTSMPGWWVIDNPTAVNYGYPQLGSCRAGGDFLRVRVRLPVGPTEPLPSTIEDPVWGGIRLHTAWDVAYATPYGGNHVDVEGVLRQANPPSGPWDLFWELDIPIDASDPWKVAAYTSRLVQGWVDFQPFPGVEKVQVVMWQCRTGTPVNTGIPRQDLPPMPPAAAHEH